MACKENRKHVRVDSINLLNYEYFGEDREKESQGMGRSLNLSEAGLLLETASPLRENLELSINIGLKEEILSINGRVIYSESGGMGLSKSGVHFENVGLNEFQALKSHILENIA
jgi:hypothetical protein